jgi:4-hydroxybenzoate polyprenyltransferase
MTDERQLPLLHRLWIYQSERFPFSKTVPLLAVFSAASVTVSAQLAGRSLPGFAAYAVAFAVAFIVFFQMRALDEIKDGETDRLHRPERPIPRGLVTLRLIVSIAAALCIPALTFAWLLSGALVWFVLLIWLWLALMTVEFFVPTFLHRSPALYLVSHMAIMPLIDLFLTACEWLQASGAPPAGLWTFLWMSFCNGCVVEFGRKIWAPGNERPGVETYSSSWGIQTSLLALALAMTGALAGLIAFGVYVSSPLLVSALGIALAALFGMVMLQFYRHRDGPSQKRLEDASGYWVLGCYLIAALGPAIAGILR